jgi:D-3-phosphoglycerate dehydrogenase
VPPFTIVITDCDHDSLNEENEVASERGFNLRVAQCRSEDEVIAAAHDADGILVQYAPITDRVLAALPNLRGVGRYGVGVDTVDVDAATRRGIAVCNVPDYGTEDVSDHAVALALSLVRGVTEYDRRLRNGQYDYSAGRPLHRIRDLTFGVVGLGRIGSATARKARGLGFTVIGCDPALPLGSTTAEGAEVVAQESLLSAADVISLHLPLDASTQHLINAAALARMKPGSMLINTARGGLVDTGAVEEALRSGALRGAALDVFEVEPLPDGATLLDLGTAVLTPHVSWYTEESYGELKRRAIENVADVCMRQRPRNLYNPEVFA